MAEIRVTQSSKFTYHHIVVFFLTYFGYSLFHATRKAFSNVKDTLAEEWTPTNLSEQSIYDYKQWNSNNLFSDRTSAVNFEGILDAVFMSAYAGGLYLSGFLGDRHNLRHFLSAGMWLSAFMMFMFGTFSKWFGIQSKAYFLMFWFLCGLFQSSGWPATVTVMTNWFGKSSRGLLFGLWGSCTSVGNIIGGYIVAAVLQYGNEYAFLVPSLLLFCGGIIIFFTLIPSPKDLGISEPVEHEPDPMERSAETEPFLTESDVEIQDELVNSSEEHQAIGFVQAFCLPGVAAFSIAYACLKMVNYSFFFWLPLYLKANFNWTTELSDRLSTWYDVGGIAGAIVSGIITDRMSRRSPTVVFMLLVSPITLYVYSQSPKDQVVNCVLMAVVGFFVSGAANIISTAISADLGRQEALRGNNKALSTVTGIVDGTGSVGAAIGQVVISPISVAFGWKAVFYLFMIMMGLTTLCILPIFVHDIKYYINKYRSPSSNVREDAINGGDESNGDDELLIGNDNEYNR